MHIHPHHASRHPHWWTHSAYFLTVAFLGPLDVGCPRCPPWRDCVLMGATFSLAPSLAVAFPLLSPPSLEIVVGFTWILEWWGSFSLSWHVAAVDLSFPCGRSGEAMRLRLVCGSGVWLVSISWWERWGIFDTTGILLPFSDCLCTTCAFCEPSIAVLLWRLLPADATLSSPSIFLLICVCACVLLPTPPELELEARARIFYDVMHVRNFLYDLAKNKKRRRSCLATLLQVLELSVKWLQSRF